MSPLKPMHKDEDLVLRIENDNFHKVLSKITYPEVGILNIYARSKKEVPIIQIDLKDVVDVTYGFYDNSKGFVQFQTPIMMNLIRETDTLYVILNTKDYVGKYQLVAEKKKKNNPDMVLYTGIFIFVMLNILVFFAIMQNPTTEVK